MNELVSQLFLASGLWTVIGAVIVSILYRSKTRAEVKKMENEAAKIADETVTKRMQFLKVELLDTLGISEQRRRVMDKMDVAINSMRRRVQKHGDWDAQVTEVINGLVANLRERGIDVDANRLRIDEPPSLDFSDIDFDFRIVPPTQDTVTRMAAERGIE